MSTEDEDRNPFELPAAILLGLAAVLTAMAAYFSAAEGGTEAEARALSISLNAKGHALTNEATQTRAAVTMVIGAIQLFTA